DSESIQRCRFTIAHELGHILLGHELINDRYFRKFDISKPQIETEADMLASRLLAPACVLWGMNLHTADEIAKACNITKKAAQVRADRMATLYKRNKFLTSPLEKKVFKNFSGFICNYKKE
ncbi:MAG: ImmA/IrrE family metallo-endopeptidase, partial [Acutalibacteraceae bacterium]|nr:ImmA/IrrE family metallo-endopeptidase [Acutalibacteraceae bacterium]